MVSQSAYWKSLCWKPCLETQDPAQIISPCCLFNNWCRIVYCRWLIFADRHQTSEARKRLDMCYVCLFLALAFISLCFILCVNSPGSQETVCIHVLFLCAYEYMSYSYTHVLRKYLPSTLKEFQRNFWTRAWPNMIKRHAQCFHFHTESLPFKYMYNN